MLGPHAGRDGCTKPYEHERRGRMTNLRPLQTLRARRGGTCAKLLGTLRARKEDEGRGHATNL